MNNHTPEENIIRIMSTLSPAISDLAKCFNESPQTICNWINGEKPIEDHIAKLSDLASAANIISESGLKITGIQLNRKVHKGKNFFETVCEGGSAQESAKLLVNLLEKEKHQRDMLTARFKNRDFDHTFTGGDISPVINKE